MGIAQQIEQIEAGMEDAKHIIAVNEAFKRLTKNTDFKLLVESEYLEQEAIRLVQAKGNPGLQDPEQQRFIDNSILGIAAFQQYLNKITIMSGQAAAALEADTETHAELLASDE